MKCKKCGCDTLIKTGDWYKCANCGAEFFDTQVQLGDMKSPTMEVESIEQNAVVLNNNENDKPEETDNGKKKKKKSKLRDAIDFCIPIVLAVIVAIILKTFVFANAIVPTGSMENTIEEKDRIIASRLAYINSDPERYDVVIFKYPDDETQFFCKKSYRTSQRDRGDCQRHRLCYKNGRRNDTAR